MRISDWSSDVCSSDLLGGHTLGSRHASVRIYSSPLSMIDKIAPTLHDAVSCIPDGASIMVGGFGDSGLPCELLPALVDHGARDLTLISTEERRVGKGGVSTSRSRWSPNH